MYKYACLNPIASVGLNKFTVDYVKTEDVNEAEGILVRSASMHEMDFSDNLLCVARAGAGVNNIPLEECAKKGIVVFNTPGANANAVKELVFAGMLLAERDIIAYSELGIGRLIYQLPIPLCKMFIKEIFGGKSPDDFDEETLTTINKFFENSLNVSETSRQLFIHRNTLVYRLDKLQKSTGLDLRVFEDAITFKIALMVVRYMKYMESFEY